MPTERSTKYVHGDNNLIQLAIDHSGVGIGTMNQQLNDFSNANYMLNKKQDVNNHDNNNLINANYITCFHFKRVHFHIIFLRFPKFT